MVAKECWAEGPAARVARRGVLTLSVEYQQGALVPDHGLDLPHLRKLVRPGEQQGGDVMLRRLRRFLDEEAAAVGGTYHR